MLILDKSQEELTTAIFNKVTSAITELKYLVESAKIENGTFEKNEVSFSLTQLIEYAMDLKRTENADR